MRGSLPVGQGRRGPPVHCRAVSPACPAVPGHSADEVRMHETPRARLLPYGVALLATTGCLLVRWPLRPVLGDAAPHMIYFPAIMVAAYVGGFWPGMLATALGAVAA